MNPEEKEFYAEGNRVYKKLGKSIISTVIIFVVFIIGLNAVLGTLMPDMTNTWFMLSCFLAIIFTIFYCTYTILDALRQMNHKKGAVSK